MFKYDTSEGELRCYVKDRVVHSIPLATKFDLFKKRLGDLYKRQLSNNDFVRIVLQGDVNPCDGFEFVYWNGLSTLSDPPSTQIICAKTGVTKAEDALKSKNIDYALNEFI